MAIGLNFNFFGLYASLSPEFYWGGEQAAWWRNMAIVVIVGIMFSTFLTLVVVPVMYSLVDDLSGFFRGQFVAEAADLPKDVIPAGPSRNLESSRPAKPTPRPEPAFRRNPTPPEGLAPDPG